MTATRAYAYLAVLTIGVWLAASLPKLIVVSAEAAADAEVTQASTKMIDTQTRAYNHMQETLKSTINDSAVNIAYLKGYVDCYVGRRPQLPWPPQPTKQKGNR